MSDEVSWGLSQNHFLAPSLAGFKGKRETGPWETCIEVSWSAVERCCALDLGSDLGHVEGQVPAHFEVGRSAFL